MEHTNVPKLGKLDYERLPRWARVAYALRWAMRAMPVLEVWVGVDAQDVSMARSVITLIQGWCAAARGDGDVALQAEELLKGWVDEIESGIADLPNDEAQHHEFTQRLLAGRDDASAAISSLRLANLAAWAAATVGSNDELISVYAAHATDEAIKACRKCAFVALDAAARLDFECVTSFAEINKPEPDHPFPLDLFGPLWPILDANFVRVERRAPVDLLLEFAVGPDADPETVDAKIAEILGHLSQLHIACGGSGLAIAKDQGMAFDPAPQPEPICGGGGR